MMESPQASCSMSLMNRDFPEPVLPTMVYHPPAFQDMESRLRSAVFPAAADGHTPHTGASSKEILPTTPCWNALPTRRSPTQ